MSSSMVQLAKTHVSKKGSRFISNLRFTGLILSNLLRYFVLHFSWHDENKGRKVHSTI